MKSSAVPADWRYAVIAPIFKKDNRKECGNYSGISLLSVVALWECSCWSNEIARARCDSMRFQTMKGCQVLIL